jgi:DNA-binding transcriptional regulator PaaX
MATMGNGRSAHRFHAIIREREFKQYKKESIQVTLSRLHKKRYIDHSLNGWYLTKAGQLHAKNMYLLSYFSSPFKKGSSDTTIISFDIPEPDRKIRNWLRNQIKIFGYKMLQQSLWIGPGPLPVPFFKRLEELKIRKNIKIFSRIRKI